MIVRRTLARVALRAARWRTAGTAPHAAVVVGAPHTSNWDWVLTMLLVWHSEVPIRLLVKQTFFRGPMGPLMRATGAVSLDRQHPRETVERLLVEHEASVATGEPFLLVLAAEGTRSRGEHWKSGFYRIARQTGLPITLAYLDRTSRTVGWGPTFTPTGDVGADMDRVRAFYADKTGVRPAQATPPRLREEDAPG